MNVVHTFDLQLIRRLLEMLYRHVVEYLRMLVSGMTRTDDQAKNLL